MTTRTASPVLVCLCWTPPAAWSDPIFIDARRFVLASGSFVSGEERVDLFDVRVPDDHSHHGKRPPRFRSIRAAPLPGRLRLSAAR